MDLLTCRDCDKPFDNVLDFKYHEKFVDCCDTYPIADKAVDSWILNCEQQKDFTSDWIVAAVACRNTLVSNAFKLGVRA